MEAILLVGGKGARLRPLTINTPKPILPVAGAPLTAHQLAQAKAAGVDHVVLATSYKPEVFTAWLGDGSRLGLEVEYVTEDIPSARAERSVTSPTSFAVGRTSQC